MRIRGFQLRRSLLQIWLDCNDGGGGGGVSRCPLTSYTSYKLAANGPIGCLGRETEEGIGWQWRESRT